MSDSPSGSSTQTSGDYAPPTTPPQSPQRRQYEYQERTPKDGAVSPRLTLSSNRTTASRQIQVPWDRKNDALVDIVGYPFIKQNYQKYPSGNPDNTWNDGWYISRYLPSYYADLNQIDPITGLCYPVLWASTVEVIPAGDKPGQTYWATNDPYVEGNPWMSNGINRYGTAYLSISYEMPTHPIVSDEDMGKQNWVDAYGNPDESSLKRYITIIPQAGGRVQTVPNGTFVVANDTGKSLPFLGSPPIREIEADISITWHEIPTQAVPFRVVNQGIATTRRIGSTSNVPYTPAIENTLGCVNNNTFWGYPKGALMLTAAVIKPIYSPLGQRLWEIDYKFKMFNAKSSNKLKIPASSPVAYDYQYGHCLAYQGLAASSLNGNPGYYEIVVQSKPGSNYLTSNLGSQNEDGTFVGDGVNMVNYRNFSLLFRVPPQINT
jgi:hypothetical protein